MLIIEHRINTTADLRRVPPHHGVEVDLRYSGDRIVLHHDPYTDGEPFETFLESYRHAFIVLNVKNEGIEADVVRMTRARGIEEFFLLDLAFPALYKLARQGERRLAVRYSEVEPIENCLALQGLAAWIWVDCFTHLPLTPAVAARLQPAFKLCLVSPELQKHPASEIETYRRTLARDGIAIDGVCTDHPGGWELRA